MIRENLDNIPQYELGPDFSLQWYNKGYEKIWLDIHKAADKYHDFVDDFFTKQFGSDEKLLHQRQCYLFDKDNIPFATASAWFDNDYTGNEYGRVHWVAIIPQMQGKGLANPLLTIVCNRLRQLGHKRAYLGTSTARIPAINLYLKFGFKPHIRSDEDVQIWQKLKEVSEIKKAYFAPEQHRL